MSRLLVVDDNQQNCQLLETLLTRHGYDVLVAADGVEALKAARENPPDMIITDILMPGMDGYALCRQWKRDEKLKKIPFVFYTATYTDPKDEQLALRMGANRFIRKPQESQALVDIIEEIIETHKVGPRNPPSKPVLEETVYLKEYNQALIRKLEDKLVELESAKASLEREVAERKRTEETIRLTAEHLRRFVDANIVGVVIANAAGDVIEANNYYLNLIGFTQDDLKANRVDWRAITPPEWLPADENAIRELRERGKCTPYEKEFVRRDGTRVSVFLADALLPGTEEQIIAFALDLTDRKRAEHDILASETRYRRLFESAKEGILILDADTGEIVDANPFLLDLLGFTHEYFLGKRLWEIGTFRDIAASEAAFLELQEKGYVRYEDLPLETRDGQRVEVEFVSNVYLVDSTKVVQCNIRDITERVRADQERMRLAAAVERAGESFIITDADGDITYVNPAFERTSGYSAEEVLGKTPRILKSGRHGAQVYTHFWDTIVQGETWSGRFTNKKKDGTPYEVAATVTPMIGANGEIVGYVGVERDITREIQLEAQFRQTQKMEAIATLAGGIAHDFNNILSAVMGYTEMARQDLPVNSPARNALEQVHCAGVRATDLVRQILSFSREREKEYLPLQVNLVVKEVLKLLQATIPSSIRIEESIAPDCALILSDPSQIHQIVMNLCTNAYQAMPGGGVLEVRL
ncbi:MAG: PAS domain S-box protein, partial [Candidatus Hydrogenedentes bacterium]|nr:PAS domain S-box protein [Candidatus Hydrogenedentota bacterium]